MPLHVSTLPVARRQKTDGAQQKQDVWRESCHVHTARLNMYDWRFGYDVVCPFCWPAADAGLVMPGGDGVHPTDTFFIL